MVLSRVRNYSEHRKNAYKRKKREKFKSQRDLRIVNVTRTSDNLRVVNINSFSSLISWSMKILKSHRRSSLASLSLSLLLSLNLIHGNELTNCSFELRLSEFTNHSGMKSMIGIHKIDSE